MRKKKNRGKEGKKSWIKKREKAREERGLLEGKREN
jgi:hypothetical protein